MLPIPALPDPYRLLARALNALLRREDWARARLSRHAGKTVRLSVGAFTLHLAIDALGGVDIADPAILPDVTLTADPTRLRMPRPGPAAAAGPGTGLVEKPALAAQAARARADAIADMTHISGDAGLAQVVAELAAQLRWDVEDDLARLVGDIPAARLSAGARAVSAGLRDAARRLGANLAEYLSYERPVLTARPSLQGWHADAGRVLSTLDALQARVTALQARVSHYETRRGRPAGQSKGGA